MKTISLIKPALLGVLAFGLTTGCAAQTTDAQTELDKRIEQFLTEKREAWHDLNVPYEDGRVLHDLIVNNKYQSALEIGTSTGHSTVWIAWALVLFSLLFVVSPSVRVSVSIFQRSGGSYTNEMARLFMAHLSVNVLFYAVIAGCVIVLGMLVLKLVSSRRAE